MQTSASNGILLTNTPTNSYCEVKMLTLLIIATSIVCAAVYMLIGSITYTFAKIRHARDCKDVGDYQRGVTIEGRRHHYLCRHRVFGFWAGLLWPFAMVLFLGQRMSPDNRMESRRAEELIRAEHNANLAKIQAEEIKWLDKALDKDRV